MMLSVYTPYLLIACYMFVLHGDLLHTKLQCWLSIGDGYECHVPAEDSEGCGGRGY